MSSSSSSSTAKSASAKSAPAKSAPPAAAKSAASTSSTSTTTASLYQPSGLHKSEEKKKKAAPKKKGTKRKIDDDEDEYHLPAAALATIAHAAVKQAIVASGAAAAANPAVANLDPNDDDLTGEDDDDDDDDDDVIMKDNNDGDDDAAAVAADVEKVLMASEAADAADAADDAETKALKDCANGLRTNLPAGDSAMIAARLLYAYNGSDHDTSAEAKKIAKLVANQLHADVKAAKEDEKARLLINKGVLQNAMAYTVDRVFMPRFAEHTEAQTTIADLRQQVQQLKKQRTGPAPVAMAPPPPPPPHPAPVAPVPAAPVETKVVVKTEVRILDMKAEDAFAQLGKLVEKGAQAKIQDLAQKLDTSVKLVDQQIAAVAAEKKTNQSLQGMLDNMEGAWKAEIKKAEAAINDQGHLKLALAGSEKKREELQKAHETCDSRINDAKSSLQAKVAELDKALAVTTKLEAERMHLSDELRQAANSFKAYEKTIEDLDAERKRLSGEVLHLQSASKALDAAVAEGNRQREDRIVDLQRQVASLQTAEATAIARAVKEADGHRGSRSQCNKLLAEKTSLVKENSRLALFETDYQAMMKRLQDDATVRLLAEAAHKFYGASGEVDKNLLEDMQIVLLSRALAENNGNNDDASQGVVVNGNSGMG